MSLKDRYITKKKILADDLDLIKEYCKRRGWNVKRVYYDSIKRNNFMFEYNIEKQELIINLNFISTIKNNNLLENDKIILI
jgi:hypothetical protein